MYTYVYIYIQIHTCYSFFHLCYLYIYIYIYIYICICCLSYKYILPELRRGVRAGPGGQAHGQPHYQQYDCYQQQQYDYVHYCFTVIICCLNRRNQQEHVSSKIRTVKLPKCIKGACARKRSAAPLVERRRQYYYYYHHHRHHHHHHIIIIIISSSSSSLLILSIILLLQVVCYCVYVFHVLGSRLCHLQYIIAQHIISYHIIVYYSILYYIIMLCSIISCVSMLQYMHASEATAAGRSPARRYLDSQY